MDYCTALTVARLEESQELARAQLVTLVTTEQVGRFLMHAQPLLTPLKTVQTGSFTVSTGALSVELQVLASVFSVLQDITVIIARRQSIALHRMIRQEPV